MAARRQPKFEMFAKTIGHWRSRSGARFRTIVTDDPPRIPGRGHKRGQTFRDALANESQSLLPIATQQHPAPHFRMAARSPTFRACLKLKRTYN
jgi:hypothetical protein